MTVETDMGLLCCRPFPLLQNARWSVPRASSESSSMAVTFGVLLEPAEVLPLALF